jgi:phenylacetate-CoA ligase
MYSTLARHILYPIGEAFLGTKMLKYLKVLEETQWWSSAQLQELQNEKLRALIKHAYENVPYYHRIFEERGLTDKDIQTIEDLQKLPILTKDDIRQSLSDLIAKDSNKRKAFPNPTGGSTGEPLKYYIDMEVTSISWAGMFRGWKWAGYKLGDKRAAIAGSSLVTDRPTFKTRVRNVIERNLKLSALDMSEPIMSSYAGRLMEYKPVYIRGYPSVLYLFADYLSKQGITNIRPKAIFTTAEMLLPHYREVVERQFRCKVFDQYGCYDGGLQAMECYEHCGYHISVEKAIMEFIDEDKRPVPVGCSGEILATDLHNYSMPFIRYAVEDRGTLAEEQCSCGRGLPLMKSIEGRTTDIIVFSDGSTLPGPALVDLFQKFQYIKQYQVIQNTVDQLLIKLVKRESYTDKDTEHFLSTIKAHISERAEIEVEFVDEIPTTKAGKYRFIISNVPK